jgi:single-strand DNA-binding protein
VTRATVTPGTVTRVGKQGTEGSAPTEDEYQGNEHVNEIRLRGRLAASPVEKLLPSGDVVVTFRLVVSRPPNHRRGQAGGRVASVDTIECSAWGAALRRKVVRWGDGDLITVDGAIRRRFWQAQGGARSRYDVEVRRAIRERRAH